jgi:hypothetical protein
MRIDTPVLEDAKALLDELKQAYLGEPLRAALGQVQTIGGVGWLALDGDGTAEVSIRGFTAGLPGSKVEGPFDVQFGGTWSVAADCTGEIDLNEFDAEVDWLFVAVKDASELFILSGASLGQAQAKRISSD